MRPEWSKPHYKGGQLKQMNLNELLDSNQLDESELVNIPVTGISQNSRLIEPGYLFLACAGSRGSHGIAYGGEAAKKGARIIAWEPTAELDSMPNSFAVQKNDEEVINIPLIAVDKLHEKVGDIAARYYAQPSQKMQVTGVTGTNGKTSIAFFVAQCLSLTESCGIMGTIGNGIFDKNLENIKEASHTTADAVSIQSMMAKMLSQGAQHVVMEVSSHALDQSRVQGVDFDYAVFSNLSRDHLDYHGDMENYALAKRKLFLARELKAAIVNLDDSEGRKIIATLKASNCELIRYSRAISENAEIAADKVEPLVDGMEFNLVIGARQERLKIALLGDFNLSNVLATAGVLHAMGIEFEQIVSRLRRLQSVPGRMELLKFGQGKKLAQPVVDYAHTPDALQQALKALQQHVKVATGIKLWCVFGCGGNRDKGKRALMGEIAARYADFIILTNDNPRDESPREIIKDIERGIPKDCEYQVQEDRKQAILMAIKQSNKDDVILVAGKGHETYQEVKGIRHYFSDQQVIREIFTDIKLS